MKNQKSLKGLFSLDHNIKVYIPSTVEVNNETDNSEQVTAALALFSGLFGGATSCDAIGAWQSKAAGLVTEKVKIVEAYADKKSLEGGLSEVIKFAETLKKDMKQEAISLEYDNKLYFI